jgi:carboxymethylenebutenolidase
LSQRINPLLAAALRSGGGGAEGVAETLTSEGVPVAVERFAPRTGAAAHPAVVILHGSGGLTRSGVMYRELARELARRGYVACVVHYFDRTGTTWADPRTSERNFATWMRVVGDAVTYAAGQPGVDPERVGLLGFSLGAFLSLAVASRDRRVAAVAEFFGGMPEFFAAHVEALPPTLITHGDADRVVPVDEAYKVERLLKSVGAPYEMKIYPGAGHVLGPLEALDAYGRTMTFFDRILRAP